MTEKTSGAISKEIASEFGYGKKEGLLITVSGPSGVGKGTVIKKICEKKPDIKLSVSVTTREMRSTEEEGVSYFFRTEKEFQAMMKKGDILEHDIYLNNYYGTPLPPLMKMIEEGRDVLLDLTVSGSLTLMEKYKNAVTIFLLPPSMSALRQRLEKRGTEKPEIMERRILEASVEIPKAYLFEYVIVNDDLESVADRVIAIIEAEKHKYIRQTGIEDCILKR